MLTKKKLIVLVGNIGSGKSTVCKQFVEDGYVVISRDSLRYMIGAGKYIFNRDLEPCIHELNMAAFKSFLTAGMNLVIDETNVSRKMRKGYLQLAKTWNSSHEVIALVLPRLSKKESVDRRMQDPHQTPDRKVWEGVWDNFDSKYCLPTVKEGFDKVVELTQKEQHEVTHRV